MLRLSLDPPGSSADWLSGKRRGTVAPIPGSATAMVEDAQVDTRITHEGIEACVAYGTAAIAVMEVRKSLQLAGVIDGPVLAAFDELTRAHDDLRRLFDAGDCSTVPGMALSVLVLADRVAMLLE